MDPGESYSKLGNQSRVVISTAKSRFYKNQSLSRFSRIDKNDDGDDDDDDDDNDNNNNNNDDDA